MMWFFLISDALTFSGFLAAYGFMRFRNADIWPVPEDVFTHFPISSGRASFTICSTNDFYFDNEFRNHGACR